MYMTMFKEGKNETEKKTRATMLILEYPKNLRKYNFE